MNFCQVAFTGYVVHSTIYVINVLVICRISCNNFLLLLLMPHVGLGQPLPYPFTS